MTNELLNKEAKVDLFLSKVKENVVNNYLRNIKKSTVTIPTDFTLEEVNEIFKGVNYFNCIRNYSYTKERGFKPLPTYSTEIERTSDKFNLVVTVL